MPFVIVQTVENGIPNLSIVPSYWIINGQLHWPPDNTKNVGRLARDDSSRPGLGWKKMYCKIKRNHLSTYKEAEIEIKAMAQNTDTDNDLDLQRVTVETNNNQEINFEDMAQNLMNNQTTTAVAESNVIQFYSAENIDQLLNNQTIIMQKINEMFQTLNTVTENQKKIALKLASMSVQIDDCNIKIVEKMEQPVNVTLLQDARQEERESFVLKPIENQAQLEAFEKTLQDKAERTKLKNLLAILCSSREGGGTTCAYKLLDTLISREFLCQSSWSGGSRGNDPKVGLKNHKNFVNFFFYMVHKWDPKFSMEENERFFKNILKNAQKRKLMKNLRASTKRRRRGNENSILAVASNETVQNSITTTDGPPLE